VDEEQLVQELVQGKRKKKRTNFYRGYKPIGPAAQESVKSCLLNIFFVILL
jgi:hypothetical protein